METVQPAPHPGGAAVGHFHVGNQPGIQQAALQNVVAEHLLGWELGLGRGGEGLHVDQTLAGEDAGGEAVHIQIPRRYVVGGDAAHSRHRAGKGGAVGAFQFSADPGSKQAVPLGYPRLSVRPGGDDRPVERVEGNPHQLGGGVHQHSGVRVQRQQVFGPAEEAQVPFKSEKAGLSAPDYPNQFSDRPPFPLPASIGPRGFTVFPGPDSQYKMSVAPAVQTADLPLHSGDIRTISRQGGIRRLRQIGQQADLYRSPAVGVVKLEQMLGRFLRRRGGGKEGGYRDHGAPLLRNHTVQRQPGKAAGRNPLQEQMLQQGAEQLKQRKVEQDRRPAVSRPEGEKDRQGKGKQGGKQEQRPSAPLSLPVAVQRGKGRAHMPFPRRGALFRLVQQRFGDIRLAPPGPLSREGSPPPVIGAGSVVHFGIYPGRVFPQEPLHDAVPFGQSVEIEIGGGSQAVHRSGDQAFGFGPGLPAGVRRSQHQRRPQAERKLFQLEHRQRTDFTGFGDQRVQPLLVRRSGFVHQPPKKKAEHGLPPGEGYAAREAQVGK